MKRGPEQLVVLFAALWWACAGAANDLAQTDSAYLRQHADNPVHWRAWNPASLDAAVRENRLIFLSIGYASCHWCHVMERDSFMDAEIAAVLDADYVAVKVDREQQPDVDAWFSRVAAAVQGEAGWPITLVLLPNRSPLYAAHFVPREELSAVLSRLATLWRAQPDIAQAQATMLQSQVDSTVVPDSDARARSLDSLAAVVAGKLMARVDQDFGGFGRAEKFPDVAAWRFLLERCHTGCEREDRELLARQLTLLMNSGLSDAVFGGVFRYTTDRQQTRPHFEKMLYHQALTASLYFDAANWLGRPDFRRFARSIVDFTRGTLRLQDGRYGAAVDAEFAGEEGAYYLWDPAVASNLPKGVRPVDIQDRMFLAGTPVGAGAEAWQTALAGQRSGAPRVIENPVTAWNGLWLITLLDAGEYSEASELGEILWRRSWSQGRVSRMGAQPGYLDDYAFLSQAFQQLYLIDGDPVWQARADQVEAALLDHFFHEGRLHYAESGSLVPDVADPARDGEIPAPLPAVVSSLARHADSIGLADARERILVQGLAAASGDEDRFASLAALALPIRRPARTFAGGHGLVALKFAAAAAEGTKAWRVDVILGDGWHINAAEVHEPHLVRTMVDVVDSGAEVIYPGGTAVRTQFSDVPLNVYHQRVSFPIRLPAARNALRVRVTTQACSERICLSPEVIELETFISPGT